MKNKHNYYVLAVIFLIIVLISILYLYFKDDGDSQVINTDNTSNTTDTNTAQLIVSSQVSSALEEEIPLRTGYYFQEMLVSDNIVIKSGTNIIKYTNGKYLTAPYDLIVVKYNVPGTKEKCNNSHYIKVSAINVLSTQFRIDETKIDSLYIGKDIKVKIPALNDKEIDGIITDISNSSTGGKFIVNVEFDNDGSIKLGMTVNIII